MLSGLLQTKRSRRDDYQAAFKPEPAANAARYQVIDERIQREHEAGKLRATGIELVFWTMHTPACDLKTWVMAQLDARAEHAGLHYTSIGWVRSGMIDLGDRNLTGLRLVGRMGGGAGEVDHVAYRAVGPDSPGTFGDSWRLLVPLPERRPAAPPPTPIDRPRRYE